MRTNIEIDDDLLKEAMVITKIKSKRKLVNYALQEYITSFKRNAVARGAKMKDNTNKKESEKIIFIKVELSEEEKYKRRLQLLSLRGKVKMFD